MRVLNHYYDDSDDLELSDDDTPVTGFAVASNKRNVEFHEVFPAVPEDDSLIEDYACALQRDILIQGRLYISENRICFRPNRDIFWTTELSIPIYEITTLDKEMTASGIPNAIQLSTGQAKYMFTSFISRDTTFELIYNIWRLAKPENAISIGLRGGSSMDGPDNGGGAEYHDHRFPFVLQTQSFHSTMLPNLQVSVYCALTTFEPGISQWIHPSEWLNANVKHIRAIFDGIVDLTGNNTITFPATMIFQRLIIYILTYNMLCPSNEILWGELDATLKKYQDWDLLNQIRSQGNIKNQLLTIFRNASPEHRERQFEDLLRKLLFLDSIALSASVEALITDEDTYEELVETTGAGAQSLVNLLHARLDFPMDSGHKRLLVRGLTRLSETSGLYPESLTLNNVTPEHGRRATGGFADVYKGRCFDEDIAIKVFRMPLPSNINSLNSWRSFGDHFQTLFREFITWRQLSHPNVLPFYGVHFLKDTLETRFCLVSPWMENGNVVEFLARRNRTDPYGDATNCVCLALDIAQGVQYLHGEKIIHRDLKGYNVLVSPSMRCYIADFGLATLTDSGSATTLAGNAVMGTPKWLAPELIPHEEVKRNHTYASDIYAFALVCYELFSGQVPFEDVQLKDLQDLLEGGGRPSLPADDLSRRRGLSTEIEDIIRDCWAQEQTERPSADTVVERLRLLHPVDERPLNEIGTSFFMHLLRDQIDNPFAILYSAGHGLPA